MPFWAIGGQTEVCCLFTQRKHKIHHCCCKHIILFFPRMTGLELFGLAFNVFIDLKIRKNNFAIKFAWTGEGTDSNYKPNKEDFWH